MFIASKDLILNLKTELETQVGLAKEGQSLAKTMQAQESVIASLQQKLEDLTAALSDSRAENKSLSTKLAVSRSAEATLAKVPGSAVKSQGQARGTVNSDIIQAAQMKEDLYSDLTGLIVRGVKFYDKEDIFDCLQTGRNGSEYSSSLRDARTKHLPASALIFVWFQLCILSCASRPTLLGTGLRKRT